MRKLKLLFAAAALTLCAGEMLAQGTWTAPAVPGINPSTVDGTTTYYLYNVGSDAFVTYGMSWQSQAIARRLSSGDQAASDMHKMTATISDGKLSFHYNDVKDANRLLSDNAGENNCYVDTWTGDATKFTYEATTPSGAYTLTNVSTSNALDVHWKYGGHLTGKNGQGFTSWAIIPESSVTDGSYAKYKERKQMYDVYQALVSANVVSSYTTELETANAVFTNNSSTVAQLRSATRALINAAAEDIASSINGNSLFDDADMWGNQALSTWTPTAASNSDFGEYETYNITYDFNQTHDVPNGSYKIVFHSLFRNDGGGAAPRIIVTDGELDGGGTTATANVPLFSSMSFAPTNVNSSNNMSVAKQSYFSDWTDAGIPNGRRSSADALAHTNAVATVDNFKVTNGKMNIRMIIDGANQWVNFQGFDIIFYGSTTGKLYRDLVELLETSNTLKDQVMNADVKTVLTTAISTYSSLTKSSTEEELEAAITAVTTANTNANTSIANYTEANTILTAASSLDAAGQAYYAANETVVGIQSAYDARTLESVSSDQKTACAAVLPLAAREQTTENADWTAVIVNPSFEEGDFTGWTNSGMQVQDNNSFTEKVGNYYTEAWQPNGTKKVSQTVDNIAAGVYSISAVAYARYAVSAKIYAEGAEEAIVVDEATNTYTVEFLQSEDGSITFGYEAVGDGTEASWICVDNFTMKFVRAATADDYKASLASAISAASSARKALNEGEGVFQIPAVAGTNLAAAITAAQRVYDDDYATISDVTTAISTLNTAVETYEATTLNAPGENKKYYIKVATDDHAKAGNAIVIVPGATSDNNPTGYGLNANFAPNANLAQAVTFTQVSGNNYNISFETTDGTTYLTYGTTNGSAAGWANSQIQATTDDTKKGEFKIAATATDNVFNIVNTLTNTNIDCQAGGNIYTDENITLDGFSVAEASQASIAINTSAAKWGTTILPFAVASLPEGVKAYTCTAKVDGKDNELNLEVVTALEANKPYIIEGEWDETKEGWGLGAATSNTVGWLTGVYAETNAPVGSYVLQKNNDVVGFYLVADGAQPKVKANRCYLTVPNSARAFFLLDSEATAIKAIETLTSGEAEIYNAAGARVPGLQKGMNIIRKADGQSYKVMVK